MNALVSAAQLSGSTFLSPYTEVAAVAARPARRSPLVWATIDLMAVLVAVGAIQIVSGALSGMRAVPQVAASEQPGTELVGAQVPPMPRFAGHVSAVPMPLPTQAILFADAVVLEKSFGPAVGGPPPGRFSLAPTSSAPAGAGAGGEPSAAAPGSAEDSLLSYQSRPGAGALEQDGGAGARTIVATVAAVERTAEDTAASTVDVVSRSMETAVSTGGELVGQAAAATTVEPVFSATESAAAGASSSAGVATQSAAPAIAAATSAAGSAASGASSAVSQVTSAVGGLLN